MSASRQTEVPPLLKDETESFRRDDSVEIFTKIKKKGLGKWRIFGNFAV